MKTRAMVAALIAAAVCAPMAFAAPAVIKDGACTMTLPDGAVIDAQKVKVVVAKGKSGVVAMTCQSRIPGYNQGQWTNRGFECAIPLIGDAVLTTTDSRLAISPNGNAVLTCKAKTNVTPR